MRDVTLLLLFGFYSITVFPQQQEVENDTIKTKVLEEVVVTGQYNKKAVSKALFDVKVITRKEMEVQGATNLADILNQTLNLNILPNTGSGKSQVSLFGLDGQYFKVLVDNVPIINEEGFGNNTDLTQINLEDIERVEIVEGAMGVQYGSNAVSGVINIITKRAIKHDVEVSAYVQEETVGEEYEWFAKGRHIQSLKISSNWKENLFLSGSYTRNDFGGFWNDKKGEKYVETDNLRGHEWLPKLQNNAKLLINHSGKNYAMFYKMEYFNEKIANYDSIVIANEHTPTVTRNPFAFDATYYNNRFYTHFNITGTIKDQMNYDVSLSFQKQEKDIENYTYYIYDDRKENIERTTYLERQAWFNRATFSNLFKTSSFAMQLGYEITLEKGEGSPFAFLQNDATQNEKNTLNNYDLFASSEIKLKDTWMLRPGARISFTNQFDPQLVYSLTSNYIFTNGLEIKGVLGSANRTPNYEELYTYFVDVNHNVQGNPDLNPESGISAFIHFKKTFLSKDPNFRWKSKWSFNYLDVNDRIELIVVNTSPLESKYNNIDSFTSIGSSFTNSFFYKNWKANLGITVLGMSKQLDSNTAADDGFLTNIQWNSNVLYSFNKNKATAAFYYKHVGKQYQFVENAEGVYERGETEAFSWLNITLSNAFFNKKLTSTFGVRNILDISSVSTTALAGGTHSAGPSQLPVAYGRSYFIKLAYNFNI